MLQQKLSDDDIAVLEIMRDPIWLGEWLRSTNDGEVDEQLQAPTKWKYRDYQRQFLSDTSEFILYTGGRAIGKCQPSSARIYTDQGYRRIGELTNLDSFVVYTLTPELQLEQRRAVVSYDNMAPALTITSASGHKVVVTYNHPILTPTGYKPAGDITTDDYIAVATHLPFHSTKSAYQWHELRILGYTILNKKHNVEAWFKPRFPAIGTELEYISEKLHTHMNKKHTGEYQLKRPLGPFKHPVRTMYKELHIEEALDHNGGVRKLPVELKTERLDNIQIFLEALLAQFATLSKYSFSLTLMYERLAVDFKEIFLRFGIETKITRVDTGWRIESLDLRAAYRLWNTFTIPGVVIKNNPLPPESSDATEFMRFEQVTNVFQSHKNTDTYAIYVYDTNNYISNDVFVHNTVVLEDKIIFDIVNQDIQFPMTKESVLVTPNQAQLTPLLNKIQQRFTSGKILKDFLKNNVNKQEGTMRFPVWGKPHIFHFRIAGSRAETNMIGLHVPRILGDETQLFPLNAYTQLGPAWNHWEPNVQQVWAGVPNGLRNTTLYKLDEQSPHYKKYHIPSHMNPYYTFDIDQENIRKYGGRQDDRYQNLVLGRHGNAAYQVIPRDSIITEPFVFYSFTYSAVQAMKGKSFQDVLDRPNAIPKDSTKVIFAIDPGFVDPTVIQILALDKHNKWRTHLRYKLRRIDFNEQQAIIDWLAKFYKPDIIAIDIGAGGQGPSIMHNLMYSPDYAATNYQQKMFGVQFSELLVAGYDDDGEELKQDTKTYAANELATIVQEGRLIFSELDHEGLSQLERVAKTKSTAGKDRYYVLSDNGSGPDPDDHIFASYICFIVATRQDVANVHAKKLGKASGTYHSTMPL